MGKLSYYFAVSLDGFIAREDGAVDWLDPYAVKLDTPYDPGRYWKTVSAVAAGRKTFVDSLKLGPWDFGDVPGYVYTRDPSFSTDVEGVEVISKNVPDHVRGLRKKHDGRIWLFGGGVLAASLIAEGLLDELAMTVVPVTIGAGIPWLAGAKLDETWQLKEHYTTKIGIVQLVYESRRHPVMSETA